MATDIYSGEERAYPPLSWGVKAMILAGGPAVGLAIGGVAVVLPKIEAALAHGPEDKILIKMLVGAVGLAMVLGAPLTGFLADRVGLRRVMFWNYLVFTVAGSAGMYLENLPFFVFARFLLGVAGAGAVTASIIAINQLMAPSQRAQWMGWYIAVASIAGVISQPVVGYLAEYNWHYAFGIYLCGAPFIMIALTAFKAVPEVGATSENAETKGEEPNLFSWFPYRFAVLGLLMGCVVYLPIIYLPFQLRDMGIGPGRASLVLMFDVMTGTITALLFGRSRKYLGSHGAFVFAFLLTGIGAIITALAPNYAIVMIGMSIFGFGQGWFMPNLMVTLGTRVKPVQQGRAAGLVKASNYASTTVCIIATERLSQIYGPRLPVGIAGLLALGLLALVIVQMISRRNRAPAQVDGVAQAAS